jgi:hypothetical protein
MLFGNYPVQLVHPVASEYFRRAADESFKKFVLDQLSALPELRAKASSGRMVCLRAGNLSEYWTKGSCFTKNGRTVAADYTARGMRLFTYESKS